MSETWKLEPLLGVGPLRFGMSRDEVASLASILGPIYAEFSQSDPDNGTVLQQARDLESPVLYFRNNRLKGIQLDSHTKFNITFNGVSVFSDPSRDVLMAFENANGEALYGLGAVLFSKLSVSTNGFVTGLDQENSPQLWDQSSDKPPKVVNVEMQNAYNAYLNKYQPITFKAK